MPRTLPMPLRTPPTRRLTPPTPRPTTRCNCRFASRFGRHWHFERLPVIAGSLFSFARWSHLMRHLVLALVGSSLVLSGCGKEEATGNTSALDQTVTAEDFAASDAT